MTQKQSYFTAIAVFTSLSCLAAGMTISPKYSISSSTEKMANVTSMLDVSIDPSAMQLSDWARNIGNTWYSKENKSSKEVYSTPRPRLINISPMESSSNFGSSLPQFNSDDQPYIPTTSQCSLAILVLLVSCFTATRMMLSFRVLR